VELQNGKTTQRSKPYTLVVVTGDCKGAGTDANISVTLIGSNGHQSGPHTLQAAPKDFERGSSDEFMVTPRSGISLGKIEAINVAHDNSGRNPEWFLHKIVVRHLHGEPDSEFLWNDWIQAPKLQQRLHVGAQGVSKLAYTVSIFTGAQ
jgi:PLAT/LH2 domain